MSTGYKIEGDGIFFLTFQIVGWVDVFSRKSYKDIVIESLQYCQQNKGLTLFAYVIMSNHMHLLAQSENGVLSDIIRDFKSYTSKEIIEAINDPLESRKEWMDMVFKYYGRFKSEQKYQIWSHENHAENIFSQKFIEQKLEYIHNNPVRAGIVKNAEDYLYSSASNYADQESLLDVVKLTIKWKTVH